MAQFDLLDSFSLPDGTILELEESAGGFYNVALFCPTRQDHIWVGEAVSLSCASANFAMRKVAAQAGNLALAARSPRA
jgi:hypothetical protein